MLRVTDTDRATFNEVHLWSHWLDERAALDEHLELLDDPCGGPYGSVSELV